MKIQVIGYDTSQKLNTEFDVEYTTFNSPNSLDEYDINVINLQNENIWRNKNATTNSINQYSDFLSLKTMIANSTKAKIIVALPQNYNFQYYYAYGIGAKYKDYQHSQQLKNMIYNMVDKILCVLIPLKYTNICYENTKTFCEGEVFHAAFYFTPPYEALSLSHGSEKMTTVLVNNVICTMLDICNQNTNLDCFLSAINLIENKEKIPEWLYNIDFNDDNEQKDIVSKNIEEIEKLKQDIENANQILEKNMHYKSMLYTNGSDLATVVFEVLEQILDYDLSDFKDKLNEDFLIEKDEITFIGEIKGISSNVNYDNIAQIERHYRGYLDELQDENEEKVKQLLVINPLRKKELSDREEIHENQIKLAKRNGCLIITTEILLYVFEKFLKEEIDTESIVRIFAENDGLLTKEMLNI